MIDDGILVLNKPGNWTSHDCVAICRRVLRLKGVKKIGHGGTLDPMAEGVLPIFIGQATRIMEYLELDNKKYTCRMQLGVTTDTQDIWGRVLTRRPWEGITEQQVLRELEGFRGIIQQMPPLYSAVRIDGKHLYEYAHKNRAEAQESVSGVPREVLERVKPRRIHIAALEVEDMDLSRGTIRFSVECSKGTYIRTICSDLGERLGCGAAMTGLTRTAVGSIDLEGSVSPETIKRMDRSRTEGPAGASGSPEVGPGKDESPEPADMPDLEDLLLPTDAPLTHFGRVSIPDERAHYFRQGNSIRLHQVKFLERSHVEPDPLTGEIPRNARGRRYDRIHRVYRQEDGLFLGTGFEDRGRRELRADKVFTALNEPKKKNGTR